MPGRQFNNGNYRYGFNGKENDNEVKGTGNQQDYGLRIYDPRLGKFLSVDPLTKQYPELTPYQFASNRPIDGIDLDGAEWTPAGVMSSYAGYNMNANEPVQKQQAQQFVHHGIEALKKPSTYSKAMEMMRPFVLIGMTAPFGGAGGGLILEAEFSAPAVSTFVESPIIESSVVSQFEKEVAAESFVFRGDARSPSTIFEEGFTSKGNNMNLLEHATSNPSNSGYIPTSNNVGVAMESAEMNQGYVYTIKNNPAMNYPGAEPRGIPYLYD